MTYFINTHGVHCTGPAESLWLDNARKLIIFARGGLLYAFNLHPTWSQEGVFVSCRATGAGGYKIVLSTDDWPFGGHNRTNMEQVYHAADTEFGCGIRLFLPWRCGVALEKIEWQDQSKASISKPVWTEEGPGTDKRQEVSQ